MNKADTVMAKAKDLTERSPYLWTTVKLPIMMGMEGNPFIPKDYQPENEEDMVPFS